MFYNTPDVRRFVAATIRYRAVIIGFYLLLFGLMLFFLKPQLVSSDELYWLNQSKAWEKTQSKEYSTAYVSRLSIEIEHFTPEVLQKLKTLRATLSEHPHILEVDSLFAFKKLYNDIQAPHSAMIKVLHPASLDFSALEPLLHLLPSHYVEQNEHVMTLHFYIYATAPVTLDDATVNLPFSYSQPRTNALISDYLIYVLAIVLSIMLIFRSLFKNYISGLMGLFIVQIVLLGAIYANTLFTQIHALHLATALIVVSISLVDYLFFYYRWHVSHYKANSERAMHKAINRNLFPAMWTTLLTVLSLGALLFVDSIIVRHLSMSVIAASILTYVLNITLLPAMLSFFHVTHPRVAFAKICYAFAQKEMFYNARHLKLFLGTTLGVLILGVYMFQFNQATLFTNGEKSGAITAKLPLYELDYPLVQRMLILEETLKAKLNDSLSINSIAHVLHRIHEVNYPLLPFDENHFLEAYMYMQLYDFDTALIEDEAMKLFITFDPHRVNKAEILGYLEDHYEDIHLTDVDSLINRAKASVSLVLMGSLLTALLLVGLIMSRIFRAKEMLLVGFMVNATPIVWFGFILVFLGFPLTIEALIAMTITLALGSDATVHFAYKYFRSRYFGRSKKHALEIMFFYAGVPVIIGSLILMIVFIALTFTSLYTLQLIGIYGALLMLLSLLTDLFVLPVMLLAFDRYFSVSINK